ncbi:hypothetical protein Osc1_09490 [Hominimerdicola sp. 21CYCFAH17_S]
MKTSTETVSCTEYTEISEFELDCVAKMFLTMIQEFYATEEGQAAFEAWISEKECKAA